MGLPFNGLAALAQRAIDPYITSNFYARSTLLAVLLGQTMMDSAGLGHISRPGAAKVLAGSKPGEAEQTKMRNMLSYSFGIQAFKTNNTVVQAAYSNMPTLANPTTASGSQVRSEANIPWTGCFSTPMEFQNTDLDMAIENGRGNDEMIGINTARVIEDGTEVFRQDHFEQMASQVWSGLPSNWNVPFLDALPGILNVCDNTKTYAQVTDRANLTTGSSMISHTIVASTGSGSSGTVAAIPTDIVTLIDDAELVQGVATTGSGTGVDLALTTPALYKRFKDQVSARGALVTVSNLPQMAKIGYNRPCLQYQNTYITYDTYCPASTVAMLSLASWRFITHPKYSFTVMPLVDIRGLARGAPNVTQGFINTWPILACRDPSKQVIYNTVL